VEYPDVRMRVADFVVRLEDGRIVHIELQSGPDPDMPWRMLEYYHAIRRTYKQAPVQFVIYVGKGSNTIKADIEEENLSFHYTVMDMREVSAELLLESDSIGDNLLAVLCEMKDPRAVIRTVVERVNRAPEKQRSDLIAKLMILSELRNLEPVVLEEVERMPITVNLMESEYWRGVLEKARKQGAAEGLAEGLAEGRSELLRCLLEQRFVNLPGWVAERLRTADADTLDRWALRLSNSLSVDDVIH